MKQIEGFNHLICSDGTVISNNTGRAMSTKKIGAGYVGLNLWDGKKHVTKYIHRLVAEHFIPNPSNLPEVNHKDGNKENNDISNLEWCTVSHNRSHARNVLLINRNPVKVITDDGEVEYNFGKECAKALGMNYSFLMNILNGYSNKPKSLSHITFEYKGIKI